MQNQVNNYKSSVAFVRDLFQFLLPGLIFISIIYYLFPPSHNCQLRTSSVSFNLDSKSTFQVIVLLGFSYLFGITGNFLTRIFFGLFQFAFCWMPKVKELKDIENKKNELIKRKYGICCSDGFDFKYYKELMEFDIFNRHPELHQMKIERNNTLTMFWRSLSGLSLLVTGCSLFLNSQFSTCVIVSLASIFAVIFFCIWMRQEKILNRNFIAFHLHEKYRNKITMKNILGHYL